MDISTLISEIRRSKKVISIKPCDGNHIDNDYFHDLQGFCHFKDCLSLKGISCDCEFETYIRPNKLFKRWE